MLNSHMANCRIVMQATLGSIIKKLQTFGADEVIKIHGYLGRKLYFPHSYRGFYENLAFETREGEMTVGEMISFLQSVIGETFEGYKGGDFIMNENTKLWVSTYGSTSDIYIADAVRSIKGNIYLTTEVWID